MACTSIMVPRTTVFQDLSSCSHCLSWLRSRSPLTQVSYSEPHDFLLRSCPGYPQYSSGNGTCWDACDREWAAPDAGDHVTDIASLGSDTRSSTPLIFYIGSSPDVRCVLPYEVDLVPFWNQTSSSSLSISLSPPFCVCYRLSWRLPFVMANRRSIALAVPCRSK